MALILVLLLFAVPAHADWSGTDCSRWVGTPQAAACYAANAKPADDCSKWQHGGREWQQCQERQVVSAAQRCERIRNPDARTECILNALDAQNRRR